MSTIGLSSSSAASPPTSRLTCSIRAPSGSASPTHRPACSRGSSSAGCSWSEGDKAFSDDDLLTHATIYWAGNAIDTSIRTYANNNRYPWTPSHDRTPAIEAPTGITFVGYENPPGVNTPEERVQNFLSSDRAAWYNHVNLTAHPHGGHFIPWELPGEWTDDLRRTFRPYR